MTYLMCIEENVKTQSLSIVASVCILCKLTKLLTEYKLQHRVKGLEAIMFLLHKRQRRYV